MGNAGQLASSFRRQLWSSRRSEQPALSRAAVLAVAVISIVSRSALSTILALLLWSVLPTFVGFQTTTVMSGSMQPRLMVGDAIVVRHIESSQLSAGQVLLFDDPDRPGHLRMHRLISLRGDGALVTRGDANSATDTSTVGFDAVHGAAFLRIPYAGLPNYWIRTGQVLPLLAAAAGVVLLLAGVRLGRLLEEPEKRRRRHRGVKLAGSHRATAAAAAMIVLVSGSVVPTAGARAAYSATTSTPGTTWGTACSDLSTPSSPSPSLYYGYGAGSGSTDVPDLSGAGDTGTLRTGATRAICPTGWSSNATFDGVSGVVTPTKLNRAHPAGTTIATWFRVSPADAGGVLADFGNSNLASASSAIDDALYMSSTGTLTFAVATLQVTSLVMGGWKYCSTAAGYADDKWHLVVATVSTTACSITVDAKPSTTSSTPVGLSLMVGAFSGGWRFGYDDLPSGLAGAPTRDFFKGTLDETQVYDSMLTPPTATVPGTQAVLYNKGHGGPTNL